MIDVVRSEEKNIVFTCLKFSAGAASLFVSTRYESQSKSKRKKVEFFVEFSCSSDRRHAKIRPMRFVLPFVVCFSITFEYHR